mmetsp:Transcript_22530/g.31596  ORF Transcript_22530/g.31596 Transcript_22530/m.31596 type:complete len:263 (+) Transcript_22530:21-809(+)
MRLHITYPNCQGECRYRRSLHGNTVDNVEEVSLQRGTSNETAINVWLGEQFLSVCSLHTSTVLDTDLGGNFRRYLVGHVRTDLGMGLLRHFRSGSETSSDSPDWLVSNSDIFPVLFFKELDSRVELLSADLHSDTRFSLFLLFSDGKHDLEALSESDLELLSAKLFSFSSHTKSLTTLGVANNHPSAAKIGKHVSTDLTSVGTILFVVSAVLGTDSDVFTECCKKHGKMDVRSTDGNLTVGWDRTSLVEGLDTFLLFGKGTI